ncbi:MAG: (2Fe-2S)-binding protein [Candidatus Omnitrophota bacterium]
MQKYNIEIKVNGKNYELEVNSNTLLVEVIRDQLLLNGTKNACNNGECGSCTVIMNAKSVLSCLILAADCNGAEITTIEGLSNDLNKLHPIQEAFVEKGAIQCGFCTPGMILSAKYLLDTNPDPSEEEIKIGMSGNLCRCTGYVKIIEAVKEASRKIKK